MQIQCFYKNYLLILGVVEATSASSIFEGKKMIQVNYFKDID